MDRRARRRLRRRRALRSGLAAAGLVWGSAATAPALPPASHVPPAQKRAKESFERFAEDWMGKFRRLEEHDRRHPTVQPGARTPVVTYRGYGEDFSIELRPTGHPEAPFVGLLRYLELLYSCRDVRGDDCTVASSVPVTEIFRFQNGRWVY
jgi:hypothetical protein